MLQDQNRFGSISRRDFMKTCLTVTAMLGLPYSATAEIAEAAEGDNRPPVVWLHFQECTGCSETLLRGSHPDVASLIMDVIDIDYHETIMAGSGVQAEEALHHSLEKNRGKYILVVEGAIPTKDDGIYSKVGGKTALDSLKEAAEGAAAIVAIGSCATFGGVVAAYPNPTGATGVGGILEDRTIINLPGCPPSPYNLLSTILYIGAFGKLPELMVDGRPKFAYGRKIHEHCERRPHFDAGRFAEAFGDEGHRNGYCLYRLGCKGPGTYANCSTLGFNDLGLWPVATGHPCIGCTEPHIAFNMPIAERIPLYNQTPPATYPDAGATGKGKAISPVATGIAGLLAGAGLGAAGMMSKKLPEGEGNEPENDE